MKSIVASFWSWYEKHYTLSLTISAGLFLVQIIHLWWLATYVIAFRLTGHDFSFIPSTKLTVAIFSLVDYSEIPALIGTILIYLHDLKTDTKSVRAWFYLAFLNLQWVHLFWLTDEIVIQTFTGSVPIPFHPVIAWSAIIIDYLEVPVIFSTLLKLKTIGVSAMSERD